MEFANQVFDLIENLETKRKHYRIIEQLEAAVTSVPMNIAEGKGRNSQKEFMHFLYISRGSLYETLTLLEIFQMRSWIKNDQFGQLESQANELAKMINGHVRYLAKKSLFLSAISYELSPISYKLSAYQLSTQKMKFSPEKI